MKLQFLQPNYSVCQLEPNVEIPGWANAFFSICRTDEELTIIIDSQQVPNDTKAQHDFVCFRVLGEMEFDVIGVIARISKAIADAEIPILSISTYDTDYFLIPRGKKESAKTALIQSGYEFQ